jgi:ABC-type nitrate/sulfonate/bicarbonate transport system substrate-binding protein
MRLWLMVLVAALVALGGCGDDGGEQQAAGGVQTVKMATVPVLAMGPQFVADDLKLWEKHGIRMSYQQVTDPYALLAVQSQGKLDANIVATGAALFNAVNSHLKFKVAADRLTYRCSSDNLLLVRKALYDKGFTSPAGLKGKKVAVFGKGTATEFQLEQLLQQNGMKASDVRVVPMASYPDIVTGLKTGALDAGFVAQPVAAAALADGTAERLIGTDKIVPGNESGVITFSDAFIDRNDGDTSVRWLSAWLEAVRYFQDPANRERVIQIVAKHTKLDAAVVTKLYGTDQWPWAHPNGVYDVEHILGGQAGLDWLVDNELVKTIPDASEYYAEDLLNRAVERVGKVEVQRDCADVPPFEG